LFSLIAELFRSSEHAIAQIIQYCLIRIQRLNPPEERQGFLYFLL